MIGKQERNKKKVNLKQGDSVTVTRRNNIVRSISDNTEDNTYPMYYSGQGLFGIIEYNCTGSVYGHFVSGMYCIHPYELNKHEIYDARLDN